MAIFLFRIVLNCIFYLHILKTRRILVSTNTNNIYLNPKKMFYLLIALALAVKVYIIAYFNITNNNKK